MSPAAQSVLRRLDEVRQHWWLFTLLSSAVLAACLSIALLQTFVFADALVRLPRVGLWLLAAAWLIATCALLVLVVHRLLASQRSLEATARRVEVELPEVGSDLINLVQLSDDGSAASPSFVSAAVDQASSRLSDVRFERAAYTQSRWRRLLHCMQTPRDLAESLAILACLILLAGLCQAFVPNWASAANRLLQPWKFVPSVGSVQIVRVSPGDTELLAGSSLQVEAEIRNPAAQPYTAALFVTPHGEATSSLPMAVDETRTRYTFTVPAVLKPIEYRLEIGDSQSPMYRVGVRQKPTIAEAKITLEYPPYLNRPKETFTRKQLDLDAPQYSVVEFDIRPTAPIATGHLQCGSKQYVGRVEDSGNRLLVSMPLLEDGIFTVHLLNDAGQGDPDPRANRITVVPDQPPTADLVKPAHKETVAPGSTIATMIRATDDHGLDHARLEMKIQDSTSSGQPPKDDNASITTIHQWDDLRGQTAVAVDHPLKLSPDQVKSGQTVLVRAVVWDQRLLNNWGLDLKPQQAQSDWHAIQVVSKEAKATSSLQQLDQLRDAVWKLLQSQLRARVAAASILHKKVPAEAASLTGEVRAQQIDIQKRSAALVESIDAAEGDEPRNVRRTLNELAVGPMLDAVRQCDALARLTTPESLPKPVTGLAAVQDSIIKTLQGLLDLLRRAESRALTDIEKRPGGDLPNDVQQKLQQLHDKLEELLKQQKKLIDATQDLAKKPVEDFTDEDEQLLKRLAATEDDFARFMKDFHSDLSKLPEQDFANPSLLKELVEIQTEIKMAEDALLKKTADIAVPLEQLGYEMAEQMTTNLEKWLPDTPDREKWSQEESLSDADKEAPMAELPGELEDLVGELMEDEESLFDEMEDVTSSAADSLDKGAGWDAMDGPISNMSARGVTGNRLPNTSEIGGRSGEGRSGKSSGEFVGDEAVGKGGRKTPSRLTPDAFVKGQIKDHSKDPTGGATGGGKESGEGGQGLEGPAARSPGKRDLNRLAGKQAELRNRAEAIDVKMQISNYHHTDLKKLIDAMGQVQSDLKAGRYRNALRQRQLVLDGLGNVKQYVGGEFQVRQDATLNVPSDIQKEILGGMQDPSPAGWEELNRQYFKRLSATPTTSAAPATASPKDKP